MAQRDTHGGGGDDVVGDGSDPRNDTDGSDNDGPIGIVSFLKSNAALVREFFNDPVGFIMTVFLGWVVGKFVDAWTWTLDGAIAAGQSIMWAQFQILDAYISPVFILGGSVEALLLGIQEWNIAIASGLGPLAPIVAVLLIAGEAFLALVLIDFLIRSGVIGALGSLPVVGTIFSAVGQAYVAAQGLIDRLREVMFPQ